MLVLLAQRAKETARIRMVCRIKVHSGAHKSVIRAQEGEKKT